MHRTNTITDIENMEDVFDKRIQPSKTRLKINRSYPYRRQFKTDPNNYNTCWNTHWSGKQRMRVIRGFIEKWVGFPFDDCLSEFVNDSRFKDSNGWKLYGNYYTPRKYFDTLFEGNNPDYMIDEDGNIYDLDNKKHKVTHQHKDLKIGNGETLYWKWNMKNVQEYWYELCRVLGKNYMLGINNATCITSQDKYNKIKEKIENAKILDHNPDRVYNGWEWQRGYTYCERGERVRMTINDFLIRVHNIDVIPYGSKRYNSMRKQIIAQQKAEAKEVRWKLLAEVQEKIKVWNKQNKKRTFMSEYVELLNDEIRDGK